ncbi:MAG TPA: molybdopterin-dependent oxidoreductase, partial [Terriglobales bacterium]|nr:molybdopterin-dependent oxidoreductase [Terriglobales bacterium]
SVFAQVAEDNGEAAFITFLAGNDPAPAGLCLEPTSPQMLADLRAQLKAESNLVVAFGSEVRDQSIAELAEALPQARFICLGDYANSRGAADMGLYPDLLPGYVPLGEVGYLPAALRNEWFARAPQAPGLTLQQMFAAAGQDRLKALYVVGSNPISRYGFDPFALAKTFLVVQDMFLTETAAMADVVLPPANAYEKSGTFTNTCGDLQLLRKAGDVSTVKNDFEIIVRIAGAMGFDIRELVPFRRALKADMGQSRGAQSGEADRHEVWLVAHGIEPKLSPFDPTAMLDEIQRLVPGYDVSRLSLMAGNDEHTTLPGSTVVHAIPSHPELVVPAEDTLFTSGTLGRYSKTLNSVMENPLRRIPADKNEVAAD